MKRVLRLVAALAAVAFAGLIYLYVTLPDVRPLAKTNPTTTAFMELRAQEAARQGKTLRHLQHWVPYAQISGNLKRAVLVAEDDAFWQHEGVDIEQLKLSIQSDLEQGKGVRGGSTITQQLAKGVFLSSDRTFGRKAREALIAVWLEVWLTKDQIMERYLSNVYFGDNVYGLRAAARHYFNRAPDRLTIPQAAMLAGLLKAPSRLAPTTNLKGARARAALVTQAMVDAGYITQAERNALPPARLNVHEEARSEEHTSELQSH